MTAETTTTTVNTVDFDRLAARLSEAMAQIVHHDEIKLYGNDLYAEALRRALGYRPASGDHRDWLTRGEGLQVEAYAKNLYDSSAFDRMMRERAEQEVKEARAETRRVYREAGKDLADYLRNRCNERSVPSKYRRDGVAWAADMIDPTVPKDPYGNLRPNGGGQP